MTSQSPTHNSSSSTISSVTNDWKLRKPLGRPTHSNSPDINLRRHNQPPNHIGTLNTSRSKSIHQSNGSLHSDSQSSSSISPAPSPSPRPQSAHVHAGLGKRWSSTGDFGAQSPLTGRYVYKFIFLLVMTNILLLIVSVA